MGGDYQPTLLIPIASYHRCTEATITGKQPNNRADISSEPLFGCGMAQAMLYFGFGGRPLERLRSEYIKESAIADGNKTTTTG